MTNLESILVTQLLADVPGIEGDSEIASSRLLSMSIVPVKFENVSQGVNGRTRNVIDHHSY